MNPRYLLEKLVTGLFYILPHHLISRTVLRLSHSEKRWLSRLLIGAYTRLFTLNMNEALEPSLSAYPSLNALFTRALAPDARPLAEPETMLVSPADGAISEIGHLDNDRLLQAKGYHYSLQALFAGHDELARPFIDGEFATISLSPRDYHRLHMPVAGRLTDMIYIPGRLFSVSPMTTRTIPRIFTRNERLVCLFDSDIGRLALIMVGAINVSAMETVWAGLVTPPPGKTPRLSRYAPPIALERGAEMGRFNMGSTIIVLTEKSRVDWLGDLTPGRSIRMGEGLGSTQALA